MPLMPVASPTAVRGPYRLGGSLRGRRLDGPTRSVASVLIEDLGNIDTRKLCARVSTNWCEDKMDVFSRAAMTNTVLGGPSGGRKNPFTSGHRSRGCSSGGGGK